MSRTDRHRKVEFVESYSWGKRYWSWWITVGRKHFSRHPVEKAYNSKEFKHSRVKQSQQWQKDFYDELD